VADEVDRLSARFQQDAARPRLHEAENAVEQRALAVAVDAEQGDKLAVATSRLTSRRTVTAP
jgi:hypothetical protein